MSIVFSIKLIVVITLIVTDKSNKVQSSNIKSILFPFSLLANIGSSSSNESKAEATSAKVNVDQKANKTLLSLKQSSLNNKSVSLQCEPDEWMCRDHLRCILRAAQCDRRQDCIDNSDEVNCEHQCQGNQFRCNNGRCVHENWVCDTFDDCGDNSDEQNCFGQAMTTLSSIDDLSTFSVEMANASVGNQTFNDMSSSATTSTTTQSTLNITTQSSQQLANETVVVSKSRSKEGKMKTKSTFEKSKMNGHRKAAQAKSKSHGVMPIKSLIAQVTTGDGFILNAPYLRVFPIVAQNDTIDSKNKNTSSVPQLNFKNITAPRNKGEEDEEFDKRRNNNQLNKTISTSLLKSGTLIDNAVMISNASQSFSIKNETIGEKGLMVRKPLMVSSDRTVNSTKSVGSSASAGQKMRKKNKSNVTNNRLATGRAAMNAPIGCDHNNSSNGTGGCFYGLFRCTSGKCTITSFDCGIGSGKGRRVSVSQADFVQFL